MNARYKMLLICGPRDWACLFLSIGSNFQLASDTECKAWPGSPWHVWRMPDDPRVLEKLSAKTFTLDFSFIAYRCVCLLPEQACCSAQSSAQSIPKNWDAPNLDLVVCLYNPRLFIRDGRWRQKNLLDSESGYAVESRENLSPRRSKRRTNP